MTFLGTLAAWASALRKTPEPDGSRGRPRVARSQKCLRERAKKKAARKARKKARR